MLRILHLVLLSSAVALNTGESMGESLLGDTLSKGVLEGTSLLSRMEALGHRAEEAMKKNQDSSQMLPRKGATTSIHKTFHQPGAEVTIDVELGSQQESAPVGKGIVTLLQQRMMRMRKKMSHKIRHWHMPGWVRRMRHKMSRRNRSRHKMRMRKMWMRNTLGMECKTELEMCPSFPCPMRVAKCLRRRHASKLGKGCSTFVNQMKQLRDGRKEARKAFHLALRRCHHDNKKKRDRRRCIHKARKEKHAYIHRKFAALEQSMSGQQAKPKMLQQMLGKAKNLFELRMKKINAFKRQMLKKIDGMRTTNLLKKEVKDIDDKADESMDKNKQSGKSAAKKEKSDLDSKTITDMNEGTPDFLTGDIEAPQGERDMGGWKMRVYTAEQQQRLRVDAMGKPAKAPAKASSSDGDITKKDIDASYNMAIDMYVNDPETMAKKGWTANIAKLKAAYFYSHHDAFEEMKKFDEKIQWEKRVGFINWGVAILCGGFVFLILILCIRRKRQAALGNIYSKLAVEQA